jgi:L-glyceraldehyde reductase
MRLALELFDNVEILVIHWPAAFVPGRGLEPPHPTKKNELELDMEIPLVETWKAMVSLPKSKVILTSKHLSCVVFC